MAAHGCSIKHPHSIPLNVKGCWRIPFFWTRMKLVFDLVIWTLKPFPSCSPGAHADGSVLLKAWIVSVFFPPFSISISIYLSIYLSISLSLSLSPFRVVCFSIGFAVDLFDCWTHWCFLPWLHSLLHSLLHRSVRPSVPPSLRPSLPPSIHTYIWGCVYCI